MMNIRDDESKMSDGRTMQDELLKVGMQGSRKGGDKAMRRLVWT